LDLRISITLAAIDAIKADLRRALPNIKSSHRAEAAARGLGYSTYAAMRAAARTDEPEPAAVDWRSFTGYLEDKDLQAEAADLYRACAHAALQCVLERFPRLTIFGIEKGRLERNPDGTRETPAQHHARVAEARKEFFDPHGADEFLLSLAMLARVKAIKTFSDSNSYWLKHIAENYTCTYPDGRKLGPRYVANGAVIAAAAHAGFAVREYPDSPNTTFNMSKRSLIDLDCEVRPTAPYAQRRRWQEQARA